MVFYTLAGVLTGYVGAVLACDAFSVKIESNDGTTPTLGRVCVVLSMLVGGAVGMTYDCEYLVFDSI